ncbi:pectate lyase [Cellulomonas sp. ATA003]|uniref:pectate lyase family protein n=1 Tax=Cellulomonas sp. ATA003 TaxID=3073064 RepID=UPI002873954A|nr:pectate lyase [Cellulomonas sp. ATA003]WNB85646.1 pectate lyase [Cellulomonas sp. ATA003]
MQWQPTARTTLPMAALTSALVLGLAAPAPASPAQSADPRSAGSPRGGDLGRAVLGPTDGWAAADGGTTGGSAATAAEVHHVDSWPEFQAALGGADARGSTTPRIVYVEGELDAFERADGTRASCDDFAAQAGFSQADYIAAFDPVTWDYTVTPDEMAALQDLQDAAADVQAMQTQQHIGSNTTVIGVGDDARIVGANLRIRDADDVIVRNLTVSDSTDCFPEWDPSDTGAGNWNSRYDNISIWTSTHVWIDHNTLDSGDLPPSELRTVYGRPYEVHDGLLDITHSSDLVTVSYNVLGEHDKTMLIGSSDSRTDDRGTLRVSIHHNWFQDIGQRAPRVRYGQVHVYNNLYTQTQAEGFSYYWGAGRESALYVENNDLYLADGADPADVVAYWGGTAITETGNRVDRRAVDLLALYNAANPEQPLLDDAGWTPQWHDRIQPVQAVRATVRVKAGAGFLS